MRSKPPCALLLSFCAGHSRSCRTLRCDKALHSSEITPKADCLKQPSIPQALRHLTCLTASCTASIFVLPSSLQSYPVVCYEAGRRSCEPTMS